MGGAPAAFMGGRAQLPAATGRAAARGACSVSMVATGGKKTGGAKINVKKGDFDITAPTKRVGEEEKKEKKVIPAPPLVSEVGADYEPLLKALQNENWEEADELTRNLLIWLGGEVCVPGVLGTRKRNFVYYAEVKNLPVKDMQTIDKLWTTFSEGKFGYSVQKKLWNSKKVNGDFNLFVDEIAWNKGPCGGCDKICSGCTGLLKRWTPVDASGNEFVYDLKKAKKGHLPLTSALRGTYLLQSLLQHPAWGPEPLKKGVSSGVVAAQTVAARQSFPVVQGAESWKSPYYVNKKPWDN